MVMCVDAAVELGPVIDEVLSNMTLQKERCGQNCARAMIGISIDENEAPTDLCCMFYKYGKLFGEEAAVDEG